MTKGRAVVKQKMSWKQFDECLGKLAAKIRKSGRNYKVIYGIPRGGLVTAVALSHRLGIPLALDLNGEYGKGELLMVDDIVDTGKTMTGINNRKYDVATLYIKPWRSYTPRFWVLETSKWIVFPWEKEG